MYSPLSDRLWVTSGLNIDITAIEFLHLFHHVTVHGIQDHIGTTLAGDVQLQPHRREAGED